MALFSSIKKKLGKISFKKNHSLAMLNTTQFLGVINDNIFKFVMAFLLIDALGSDYASQILSATGAIYVIPFLLFSSAAGIVADRFSKQKLLIIMKIAEMAVMALAMLAFSKVSVFGCYALLFLLSTHSAMFGPSKYGIIPELVPGDKVSKANGIITAFTYLAIIIGTFLASFLTEITHRRFTLIVFFCFLIALFGFFSSLCIHRTPAQGSKKKINLFFIREIFNTLKSSREVRHLLPAICGSAFFLFVGGFTQLNIIPFAIKNLHLSEFAGGYLFLVTALGIALGSFLAGRASKLRIELGISCIAGLIMALCFLLLAVFPGNLIKTIICLIFIGIFGGIFIVPFDTFIQMKSPDEKRGQMIGAGNFLSFFGVLIASLLLYIFPTFLHLSPAGGFAAMGLLTLSFTLLQICLLSDFFFPYVSRVFLRRLCKFRAGNVEKIIKDKETVLVLENASWKHALLLLSPLPQVHFIIPSKKCRFWLHRLFYSFHSLRCDAKPQNFVKMANAILDQGDIPCLFLENSAALLLKEKSFHFVFVNFEKDPQTSVLTVKFNASL